MKDLRCRLARRLNSFRSHGGQRIAVSEAIADMTKVESISAVELNYPQHLAGSEGMDMPCALERLVGSRLARGCFCALPSRAEVDRLLSERGR